MDFSGGYLDTNLKYVMKGHKLGQLGIKIFKSALSWYTSDDVSKQRFLEIGQ